MISQRVITTKINFMSIVLAFSEVLGFFFNINLKLSPKSYFTAAEDILSILHPVRMIQRLASISFLIIQKYLVQISLLYYCMPLSSQNPLPNILIFSYALGM